MKLAIVALLLFAAATAEFWALKKRALNLCLSAHSLALHAPVASQWIIEANGDPFLGPKALQEDAQKVLENFRARAREISTELSSRFLSQEVRKAFLSLSLAPEGSQDFASALQELPKIAKGLACARRDPKAQEEQEWAQQVGAGAEYWKARKTQAAAEKEEFAADKDIYCRSDLLLRGLNLMLELASSQCAGSVKGTKLKKACDEVVKKGDKSLTQNIEAEISDLQKQKEFNMRKLQQKWPPAVLEGLQC